MHEQTIEGELVDAPRAVAIRVADDVQTSPPALFQTEDPVEVVNRAVRVANALKAVVVDKKLVANIQGKEYPMVEAWLTLAAMLRLTTICEWTRRVEGGWEARVYVRDANGATVGAAEAQCLGTERSKKGWEDYALRSMAQTRATSKALRSVLGFIMSLAGYEATPSEEMPGDTTPPAKPPAPARRSTPPPSADVPPPALAAAFARWKRLTPGGDYPAFRAAFAGKGLTTAAIAAQVAAMVAPPHDHVYCTLGPDAEKGHDHYCTLEWEACDDDTCDGPTSDDIAAAREIGPPRPSQPSPPAGVPAPEPEPARPASAPQRAKAPRSGRATAEGDAPPATLEPERITLHRRLMALCEEVKLGEGDRHDLSQHALGKASTKDYDVADYKRMIEYVERMRDESAANGIPEGALL